MANEPIKILVVEDIKIALKMALIILQELGCEVHTAASGIQSLDLVRAHHYDVIFMDLGLPDIDGLTLTETIRKLNDSELERDKALIVALTACSAEDSNNGSFKPIHYEILD